MRRVPVFAPTAALLLLLPPPATAAPRTHVVTMDKMKFGPVPPQVHAGDTILWINKDMFHHTATATNGAFNVDLPPGAKAKMLVRRTGVMPFLCKYHPGMRGVLRAAR